MIKAIIIGDEAHARESLTNVIHQYCQEITVIGSGENVADAIKLIYSKVESGELSKEEVIKRFASLEFNRFLAYYENAADLNIRAVEKGRRDVGGMQDRNRERGRNEYSDRRSGGDRTNDSRDRGADRGDRGGRSQSRGTAGATRLFVNLGTKDGFYKASFLQFILDMSDLKKEVLGRIDMRDMNSWIEIESGAAKKMISSLDGKNYKGRRIRMNDADSGGQRGSNEG